MNTSKNKVDVFRKSLKFLGDIIFYVREGFVFSEARLLAKIVWRKKQ